MYGWCSNKHRGVTDLKSCCAACPTGNAETPPPEAPPTGALATLSMPWAAHMPAIDTPAGADVGVSVFILSACAPLTIWVFAPPVQSLVHVRGREGGGRERGNGEDSLSNSFSHTWWLQGLIQTTCQCHWQVQTTDTSKYTGAPNFEKISTQHMCDVYISAYTK